MTECSHGPTLKPMTQQASVTEHSHPHTPNPYSNQKRHLGANIQKHTKYKRALRNAVNNGVNTGQGKQTKEACLEVSSQPMMYNKFVRLHHIGENNQTTKQQTTNIKLPTTDNNRRQPKTNNKQPTKTITATETTTTRTTRTRTMTRTTTTPPRPPPPPPPSPPPPPPPPPPFSVVDTIDFLFHNRTQKWP